MSESDKGKRIFPLLIRIASKLNGTRKILSIMDFDERKI